MKIHESSEDYLETIYILKQEKGMVRSIDIVNYMNFSKPTVSVAMKKFREKGLITMDADGYIELTEEALPLAKKTLEKHNFIAELLQHIGVSKETAFHDACHIEHCLSDETFQAMKNYWSDHVKEA